MGLLLFQATTKTLFSVEKLVQTESKIFFINLFFIYFLFLFIFIYFLFYFFIFFIFIYFYFYFIFLVRIDYVDSKNKNKLPTHTELSELVWGEVFNAQYLLWC